VVRVMAEVGAVVAVAVGGTLGRAAGGVVAPAAAVVVALACGTAVLAGVAFAAAVGRGTTGWQAVKNSAIARRMLLRREERMARVLCGWRFSGGCRYCLNTIS
jgi:hypothetical protein